MYHILNLRIQPKLWKFLGCFLSLVSLVCYALSSTFIQVFGKWSILKLYLYFLCSFFVFNTMLFANKWRLPTSFLLDAHVEFFVLLATSLYSFYSDKAANKKEEKLIEDSSIDVLCLISSAAFALTLLCLSRQINRGFIIDLFNFILGYFANQIMTMKLSIVLFSTAFIYSLIVLRCYLDYKLETETDASVLQSIFEENNVASRSQRAEVDNGRAEGLHQILRIEKRRDEVISEANLREAIDAGFAKECSTFYSNWRHKKLEESMSSFQRHNVSMEDIHIMPWQELQEKIEIWIKASKTIIGIRLSNEQQLCDQFFSGFSHIMDQTFMEVCRAPVIQLLDFANAVATGSRSTDRLFKILDMFETLRDLMPEMESLFSNQYCGVLKNEAVATLKRLGEAIRGCFMELKNLIINDANGVIPEDLVIPIVKYVMNYLDAACRSWRTLEQLFEDNEPQADDGISSSSSLRDQITRIVELLESNLEAKSEIYKGSAQCSVFKMKNWIYIVQKVEDCQLGTLLGDDWIRKLTAKLENEPLETSNVALKSRKEKVNLFKTVGDSTGKLVRGFKRKILKVN